VSKETSFRDLWLRYVLPYESKYPFSQQYVYQILLLSNNIEIIISVFSSYLLLFLSYPYYLLNCELFIFIELKIENLMYV